MTAAIHRRLSVAIACACAWTGLLADDESTEPAESIGNPQSVDAYARWDVRPVDKSSLQPIVSLRFREAQFSGAVNVDIALVEPGLFVGRHLEVGALARLAKPSATTSPHDSLEQASPKSPAAPDSPATKAKPSS